MPHKVIVIGGGTGTFALLTGFKKLPSIIPTAIVTVTDSGGSSGKLRDEYGILPPGDIRQCLVALSKEGNGKNLLRDLFLYRFPKGELEGHNFGNLFLTAMTNLLGSESKAIMYASKILNIRGEVMPITKKDIDLVATYTDGSVLVGEANIDEPNEKHDTTQKIVKLTVQPHAEISKASSDAIRQGDAVVLGPGDLYTSLLSNFAVHGTRTALQKSRGVFIYISNLMTKIGQTSSLSAADHVAEIVKYGGRTPDYVIVNTRKLPRATTVFYAREDKAYPVVDDLPADAPYTVIRGDFLSKQLFTRKHHDRVKRSLIRHDGAKLAGTVLSILRRGSGMHHA